MPFTREYEKVARDDIESREVTKVHQACVFAKLQTCAFGVHVVCEWLSVAFEYRIKQWQWDLYFYIAGAIHKDKLVAFNLKVYTLELASRVCELMNL
jgi:hypothetical protein